MRCDVLADFAQITFAEHPESSGRKRRISYKQLKRIKRELNGAAASRKTVLHRKLPVKERLLDNEVRLLQETVL